MLAYDIAVVKGGRGMPGEKGFARERAEFAASELLRCSGCLLIRGPKGVGKRTLARKFVASEFGIETESSLLYARSDPASLLLGAKPRLISEWQMAPDIWNYIKKDLDREFSFGKYILTQSTFPAEPEIIMHSGAGRMAALELGTATLYDANESLALISLQDFLEGKADVPLLGPDDNPMTLPRLAEIICRGGWPFSLGKEASEGIRGTRAHVRRLLTEGSYFPEAAPFLKGRSAETLRLVLTAMARNVGKEARASRMAAEIRSSGAAPRFDEETFASYRRILEKLFLVRGAEAWAPLLKSAVRPMTSPFYRFADTSIACAALNRGPEGLLKDFPAFDAFFHDFAYHELSEYALCFGGEVRRYRDSSGLKVDGILLNGRREYGAIQIRICNSKNIDEAKRTLLAFQEKMTRNGIAPPKFLMILTSHGFMFRDSDGVTIAPINCLRP